MNFLIRKVILSEVEILQQLTIKTFLEAYSETNNAISMKAYIEAKFSLENLSRELKQTNSEFYFIEHKSEKMGFLKLNIGSSQTEPMPENKVPILIINQSLNHNKFEQLQNYYLNLFHK